ncbi:MAG: hypothetical protein IJ071_04545 [Ruminococcus sp.]|nr:hypothetical protein [Ruminococcus sp.]
MVFFLAEEGTSAIGALLKAGYEILAAVLIIGAAVCLTITAVSSHLLNKKLKDRKEEDHERKR